MNENLKNFFEIAQKDEILTARIAEAKGDVEKIVSLANEAGYDVSLDELKIVKLPVSENLKIFLDAAQKDKTLGRRLAEAKGDAEKIIIVAKQAGYNISLEDLRMATEQVKGELSDDDLDNVAGGYVYYAGHEESAYRWGHEIFYILDDKTGRIVCTCGFLSGPSLKSLLADVMEDAIEMGQSPQEITKSQWDKLRSGL